MTFTGGHLVAQAQRELTKIYPQPGWVEHDPQEIWRRQSATAQEALAKTGLRVGACFSGTKFKWILDHEPSACQQAVHGKLGFGTVDRWLIWRLNGSHLHATDASNAALTLLFNVHTNH